LQLTVLVLLLVLSLAGSAFAVGFVLGRDRDR
jgi:hypothetical protein